MNLNFNWHQWKLNILFFQKQNCSKWIIVPFSFSLLPSFHEANNGCSMTWSFQNLNYPNIFGMHASRLFLNFNTFEIHNCLLNQAYNTPTKPTHQSNQLLRGGLASLVVGGQISHLPIYSGKNLGPILSVGLGCSRA